MRTYIHKSNRASCDEGQMKNAVVAVERKEMSIRKAVEVFNVPYTTLQCHCKGEPKCNQQNEKKLGSIRTVLSNEEEGAFESLILDMDNSFDGLTIDDLRRAAYQYCKRKNIKHPFNRQTEMAGRDFVSGFLRRRKNISLRKPESVSLNHVFGLNKTSVQRYFDNIEDVLEKYYFHLIKFIMWMSHHLYISRSRCWPKK